MAAARTASSTLAAALLFAAAVAAAAGAAETNLKGLDLVEHVCKNASWYYTRPKHNMTQQYCETTLGSDKRSAAAESPRDLAVVALDLLDRAAAAADAMLGSAKGNETVLNREFCRADYRTMAHIIPVCRALAQGYKPNAHDAAGVSDEDLYSCASKLMETVFNWRGTAQFGLDEDAYQRVGQLVQEVYQRTVLANAMVEQMMFGAAADWFSDENEYM